jgi:hypothetical protein
MVVVLLFVDLKIQLFIEKLLFFQLKINAFPIFFQGWETLVNNMLFNSLDYLLFLPTVFLLYWFIFTKLRWQNLFIVIASYTFYGWWDTSFLFLIAFTTLCSYLSGLGIEKLKVKECKWGG